MKHNEEREKLIKELGEMRSPITDKCSLTTLISYEFICMLADFILQDRRRIVRPLCQLRPAFPDNTDRWEVYKLEKAIDQTLKNAGISDEK